MQSLDTKPGCLTPDIGVWPAHPRHPGLTLGGWPVSTTLAQETGGERGTAVPESERRAECAVLLQRQAPCTPTGWVNPWGVGHCPPQGSWEPAGLQWHQLFNEEKPLG